MRRYAFLLLLALVAPAGAVVIRDDVDDAEYRVAAAEYRALADLPVEGHGVLIAPSWVLTAAHAVSWQEVCEVTIDGETRKVARVVVHENYHKLPDELVARALKSGDATEVMDFLERQDDIALIELADPVRDIEPIPLYRGDAELGQVAQIVGKGATGTGAVGSGQHDPHRTELRRARNAINFVDERWLAYEFHQGAAALALEGISCNGDSGGPLLVEVDGRAQVAGLASWKKANVNPVKERLCRYGHQSYNVRVSRYAAWIDRVMSGERPDR